MRPGYTKVMIDRLAVEVPIYIDTETSQAIADEIAHRIQELEQEGGRIDTVAYALKIAYEYATSLDKVEQDALQDQAQTQEALEHLLTRLKDLLHAFPQGDRD